MLLKHNKFQLRVYLLVPRSCLCFNVSYTFFSGSCYSALPPTHPPPLFLFPSEFSAVENRKHSCNTNSECVFLSRRSVLSTLSKDNTVDLSARLKRCCTTNSNSRVSSKSTVKRKKGWRDICAFNILNISEVNDPYGATSKGSIMS